MTHWIEALRAACETSTQVSVARRLGVSPSMVNQVLRGRYKGNLKTFETRVRGELIGETVLCPVMGELSKRACQDEQRRPFAATNPMRVMVYRACRSGCPYAGAQGGAA